MGLFKRRSHEEKLSGLRERRKKEVERTKRLAELERERRTISKARKIRRGIKAKKRAAVIKKVKSGVSKTSKGLGSLNLGYGGGSGMKTRKIKQKRPVYYLGNERL